MVILVSKRVRVYVMWYLEQPCPQEWKEQLTSTRDASNPHGSCIPAPAYQGPCRGPKKLWDKTVEMKAAFAEHCAGNESLFSPRLYKKKNACQCCCSSMAMQICFARPFTTKNINSFWSSGCINLRPRRLRQFQQLRRKRSCGSPHWPRYFLCFLTIKNSGPLRRIIKK